MAAATRALFAAAAAALASLGVGVGCSHPQSSGPAPSANTTSTIPTMAAPAIHAVVMDDPPAQTPFALLELFTSEGCSSCPSAEDVLATLVKEGRPDVYPLAFHVDYWDNLGWKDRFDEKTYTDRQYLYAKAMGRPSVYTPQLIVNGTAQLIGSNESQARKEIALALARAAQVGVRLVIQSNDQAHIVVSYALSALPDSSHLYLALAERGVVVTPKAGENKGEMLRHENVVRAFSSLPVTAASGTATLTVPADVKTDRSAIVAFVQHDSSMEVLGATMAKLGTP